MLSAHCVSHFSWLAVWVLMSPAGAPIIAFIAVGKVWIRSTGASNGAARNKAITTYQKIIAVRFFHGSFFPVNARKKTVARNRTVPASTYSTSALATADAR